MNEYDSAKTAELLGESLGVSLASSPEEADILLLNTCSVREKAQEKVFSLLGRWREIKAQRPHVVIGSFLELSSQAQEEIQKVAIVADARDP